MKMNIRNRIELDSLLDKKYEELKFSKAELQEKSVQELKNIIVDMGAIQAIKKVAAFDFIEYEKASFPESTANFIEQRYEIDLKKYKVVSDRLNRETNEAMAKTFGGFSAECGFWLLSNYTRQFDENHNINYAFNRAMYKFNEELLDMYPEMDLGIQVFSSSDLIKERLIDYLTTERTLDMKDEILSKYSFAIDENEQKAIFFTDTEAYVNEGLWIRDAIKYAGGDEFQWKGFEIKSGEGMRDILRFVLDEHLMHEPKEQTKPKTLIKPQH